MLSYYGFDLHFPNDWLPKDLENSWASKNNFQNVTLIPSTHGSCCLCHNPEAWELLSSGICHFSFNLGIRCWWYLHHHLWIFLSWWLDTETTATKTLMSSQPAGEAMAGRLDLHLTLPQESHTCALNGNDLIDLRTLNAWESEKYNLHPSRPCSTGRQIERLKWMLNEPAHCKQLLQGWPLFTIVKAWETT